MPAHKNPLYLVRYRLPDGRCAHEMAPSEDKAHRLARSKAYAYGEVGITKVPGISSRKSKEFGVYAKLGGGMRYTGTWGGKS